jgi:hypothetical protein
MMTSALILACITRQGGAILSGLLGLTAGERFHAMHNLDNGNVAKSGWFTTVMLIVLACSITALVIVTLYRKLHQGRRQTRPKTQDIRPKTEEPIIQNSKPKTDGIEQRVSNIERRVSAIEQRLTNIEQEVSSFEVIEAGSTPSTSSPQASSPQNDLNVETQVLATINPGGFDKLTAGGSISEETK